MDKTMIKRTIKYFMDETMESAAGNEKMLVLIESPSVGSLNSRTIMTRNLIQDVDNHFIHAVEEAFEGWQHAFEDDEDEMFTARDFFGMEKGRCPDDIFHEEMDMAVCDSNQMQCAPDERKTDDMIHYMDTSSERTPFSDLTAYYMFVVHWPKDDVSATQVRGENMGDYITACLSGTKKS